MGLPPRTLDTMGEAIALSSLSGRMSKRAQKAARARLSLALFGPGGLPVPKGPEVAEKERLLQQAWELRELAARGMCRVKYRKEAERLEKLAAEE
jgi:hypothetical protein